MVTWQDLKQRLGRRLDTGLVGTYSLVRPRRDDGHGWPPVSHARSTFTFVHRPPGEWFLANGEEGTLIDESLPSMLPDDCEDDDPPGLWFDSGPYPWRFWGSPLRLARPLLAPALHDARPLGDPEPAVHDGRSGWSVTLDYGLPAPLHLITDDQAPIVLLSECAGYREQLTGLEFPRTVSDQMLNPPPDNAAIRAHYRRLDEHYRSRPLPLPLPGAWPEPIAAPIIVGGDIDTGFLIINMGGTQTDPAPDEAWLVRQPLTDTPYDDGAANDPDAYVHRWRSPRWQWTLATLGRPLTPEELRDVIRTTPDT